MSMEESHNPCDVVSELDAAQQVSVKQQSEMPWNKSLHGVGYGIESTDHGLKSRSRPPTRPAPRRIGLDDLDRTRTIHAKCYIERQKNYEKNHDKS